MPRSRGHRTPATAPTRPRPIVTLTTDFGTSDFYVATMKAVLIRHCPDVRLLDVTHAVPRHDVLCGSITLERAVDGFPPGTIHLAVVDPSVGTDRRLLVTELNGQTVVCPDNGLITWPWHRLGPGRSHELHWRPESSSNTFHGRDVMAPVAGLLAAGEPLAQFARPIDDPVLLDITPARAQECGRVIHIDHFGNATTNVVHDVIRGQTVRQVAVKGRKVGKIRRTYWDVAPGKPLALIGSSGLLEIAVRDGSAAQDLKIRVGDEVVVE
jgi:S-adenosyl-L-methionine hydrolase (adenosine-forming)